MHPILNHLEWCREESVELIRRMVCCESPTDTPSAVSTMADLIVEGDPGISPGQTVNCGPERAKGSDA